MCLSTSSLSISHYDPIEPIQDILNHWLGDLLISIFLFRCSVQYAIEIKISHVIVGSRQCYGFIVLKDNFYMKLSYIIELDTLCPEFLGSTELILQERTDTDKY